MEIAATPPTTPPAIAPTFELCCEGGDVEVGLEEPVGAGEERVAVAPAAVPVPEESPISAPGSTSGVSNKGR